MPNPTSDSVAKAIACADGTPLFFKTLLDSIPGFVLLAEPNGRIVYHNRAVAAAAGWDQTKRKGEGERRLRELIAPELSLRLLDSENPSPTRSVLQTSSEAEKLMIEWSARTMESETGELFLLTGRDVSRESELENHVAANQWYETMGALSGGLAHDFNNILAAILGLAEIIALRLPKEDTLQPFSRKICDSVERAKGLVGRFSQFSRKPAMSCEPQPTALVLTELTTLIHGFLTGSVSLETKIDEETPWCTTDRHILEQILLNCANFFRTKLRDVGGQCLLSSRGSKNGRHALIELRGAGEGLLGVRTETLFDLNLDTGKSAYESGTALFAAKNLALQTSSVLYVRRDDPRTLSFVLEIPVAD